MPDEASYPGRVAILGLGLIGSSLARAFAAKQIVRHIVAYDASHASLEYALRQGFIHTAAATAAEAVKDADMVILAAPPLAFASLAQEIAASLKHGAVVTDCGSVKRQAREAIQPCLPDYVTYIPSHPIAGSEKSGVEAGNDALFAGKKVIVTPDASQLHHSAVALLRRVWERTGAKVEFMPAELHDLIYAYVSHLPQLVAFAAAPLADRALATRHPEYQRFTRLTRSNPDLWAEICLLNADYAEAALEDFIHFITQIQGELKERAAESVHNSRELPILFGGLVGTCLIACASLVQEKAGVNPMRFSGNGFSDMTVLAPADPQALLADVSEHNQAIAVMLSPMLANAAVIADALKQKDKEKLLAAFNMAVPA